MSSTPRSVLPYLALAFGILALGFSAIFVRWAAAPGPVMAFYRISMAALILAPFFLRQARQIGFPKRSTLIFPIVGGLFTAFDHAIWSTAIQHTTAANATLLNNTAPLWVALVAWLAFRERLKPGFWVGLGLTLAGAGAVMGSDFLRQPTLGWGDLLALASGLFYAGYFLTTQVGRERLNTLPYVWMVGVVSSLALIGITRILDQPLTGYPLQTYLVCLGAALVSQIGGYLAVGYALGHLPASIVSPTMLGQPVMTAFLAWVLLGEGLHPAQAFGGLTVLAGIYLVHRGRQPDSRAAPAAAPRLNETEEAV